MEETYCLDTDTSHNRVESLDGPPSSWKPWSLEDVELRRTCFVAPLRTTVRESKSTTMVFLHRLNNIESLVQVHRAWCDVGLSLSFPMSTFGRGLEMRSRNWYTSCEKAA